MSLCVSVCRHASAGCFFVSIYVDMCRQSLCVSAVGHPKNIQKVKVRKSLKKGCNAVCHYVLAGCLCVDRFKKKLYCCVSVCVVMCQQVFYVSIGSKKLYC